ncbi:hypothetical protein EV426DRAFT_709407 [Tirmania nivea]|nr:hypothetical protein EV426DRAFT_709407 [Tirmania nivea]
MSTAIIESQNTIPAFKSRIPVACGLHRPGSTKPFIRAALGELSGGMKSRIPVPKNQVKNAKGRTPYSVTNSDAGQLNLTSTGDQEYQTPTTNVCKSQRFHDSLEQNRVLTTESHVALLRERIKGMEKRSTSYNNTVASTTNKTVSNVNARPATRAVVITKHSLPTGQFTPVMVENSVETSKLSTPTGQSASAMRNKALVTRKISSPTDQCPTVANNFRKFTSPTGQCACAISNKAVVTRKPAPPTGQSTAGANNSVKTRKISPPTSQCASGVTKSSVKTRRLCPPTGQSTTDMANKVVTSRKLSHPTRQSIGGANKSVKTDISSPPSGQSAFFIGNKAVVSHKLSVSTGQAVHPIANKFVVTHQSAIVTANKPLVSHNILPMSSQSASKLLNNVANKANTPPPLASAASSRVAAIRQTKAARYLKKMRPRNVPLPGVPQRAPKRTVLPGDYARLKRTVGKSKLAEYSTAKRLNVSTKSKAGVKRKQKVVLGPKGRAQTWKDVSSMPLKIRVLKRTAYDTLESLPKGNPYRYAVYGDE